MICYQYYDHYHYHTLLVLGGLFIGYKYQKKSLACRELYKYFEASIYLVILDSLLLPPS